MDQPKTRQEKKGRDKERRGNPYSAKHVRMQEQAAEAQKKKAQSKTGHK